MLLNCTLHYFCSLYLQDPKTCFTARAFGKNASARRLLVPRPKGCCRRAAESHNQQPNPPENHGVTSGKNSQTLQPGPWLLPSPEQQRFCIFVFLFFFCFLFFFSRAFFLSLKTRSLPAQRRVPAASLQLSLPHSHTALKSLLELLCLSGTADAIRMAHRMKTHLKHIYIYIYISTCEQVFCASRPSHAVPLTSALLPGEPRHYGFPSLAVATPTCVMPWEITGPLVSGGRPVQARLNAQPPECVGSSGQGLEHRQLKSLLTACPWGAALNLPLALPLCRL